MSTINLYTDKQYVFIQKRTGKLFVQSSKAVLNYKDKIVVIQNYIQDSKKSRRKISVDNFNKLGLCYVGKL